MARAIVWISGASRGIGQALARTVPWDDARVIDLSRSGGDGLDHVRADLSDPEGWRTAAASFTDELAGFDGERAVFIHCAGTLEPIGYVGEVDPLAYTRQVMLNSASPQVLGDAFVRAAVGAGVDADLVMITSGAATSVYEGWSAYGAGKAAVDHWIRTVGAERGTRGSRCRVIAVAPGTVDTAMQAEIRKTPPENFPRVDKFIDLHDSGKLTRPQDAARGIWRLLEAGFDNGAVVDLRDL